MTDIASLLTALLEGDLTAAVPVLDWLRERDDRRQYEFIRLVGNYLSMRGAMGERSRTDLAGAWDHFKATTSLLLWPELPDAASWLKKFSGVPEARPQVTVHNPPDPDLIRQLAEAQGVERQQSSAGTPARIIRTYPAPVHSLPEEP